jgi:hypothetical protein
MRDGSLPSRKAPFDLLVLGGGDRLEMRWVDAAPVATAVMKLVARWNSGHQQFVRKPVGAATREAAECSIAAGVDAASPVPTAGSWITFDVEPETVERVIIAANAAVFSPASNEPGGPDRHGSAAPVTRGIEFATVGLH